MSGSLVVPAFNEAGRIEDCVRSIAAWVRTRPGGRDWEVLVVDDGSTDGTADRARRVAAEERLDLRLIAYAPNRGKGAAIREGVLASKGDPVLVSDADLSTPLTEFSKLDGPLAAHEVAIGSRAIDENLVRRRQPLHRVLLGKVGNGMIQLFAVPGIRDTQCGFKLFRAEAARRIFARQRLNGFGFDVEVIAIARHMKLRLVEVPVIWRNDPDSRVTLVSGGRAFLDPLRVRASLWMGRYGPSGSADRRG